MDRNKLAKPAAEKISLEDAEIIMNRIVADEPHLKSDSVTLDQEVRPMTYVSTPKLIPITVTPLCNDCHMEGAPSIRGAAAHLTCPVLLIKCAVWQTIINA